jgi:hypothetical protein
MKSRREAKDMERSNPWRRLFGGSAWYITEIEQPGGLP